MVRFIILLIIAAIPVFCQTADTLKLKKNESVVIDSIVIRGNNTTKDFIILRELTIKPGDKVNLKTIDYNRERIYSLSLFNYVDLYVIQEDGLNKLLISVYEKWYIYPIPFLTFNENDFSKASYGVDFLLQNFRGRNESINVNVSLGYDPTYYLSYSNPWLMYDHKLSLSASLAYQKISNKSYNAEALYGDDFDYKMVSVNFGLGKRINQFNELSLLFGYEYVEGPAKGLKQVTASEEKIDHIPYAGLSYVYDTRDLKIFPRDGLYTEVSYIHNGFNTQGILYNLFMVDFRQYEELFYNFTAKWRVDYRQVFGKLVPYYDYLYMSGEIRGHKDNEEEGKQRIIGSAELSYTLFKDWKFGLNLPILPKNLTSARIGMNVYLFTDTGTAYDDYDELTLNRFYSGYGAGLNVLIMPHNSVRFEYAFDEYMNGEFIIGVGFSF